MRHGIASSPKTDHDRPAMMCDLYVTWQTPRNPIMATSVVESRSGNVRRKRTARQLLERWACWAVVLNFIFNICQGRLSFLVIYTAAVALSRPWPATFLRSIVRQVGRRRLIIHDRSGYLEPRLIFFPTVLQVTNIIKIRKWSDDSHIPKSAIALLARHCTIASKLNRVTTQVQS